MHSELVVTLFPGFALAAPSVIVNQGKERLLVRRRTPEPFLRLLNALCPFPAVRPGQTACAVSAALPQDRELCRLVRRHVKARRVHCPESHLPFEPLRHRNELPPLQSLQTAFLRQVQKRLPHFRQCCHHSGFLLRQCCHHTRRLRRNQCCHHTLRRC